MASYYYIYTYKQTYSTSLNYVVIVYWFVCFDAVLWGARCHLFLQIYWFYCNTLQLLTGCCHSNSGLTNHYSNVFAAVIIAFMYVCLHVTLYVCCSTLHIHLAHFLTCVFLPAWGCELHFRSNVRMHGLSLRYFFCTLKYTQVLTTMTVLTTSMSLHLYQVLFWRMSAV